MKHQLLFVTITNRTSKWVPKKQEMWQEFTYEFVGQKWGGDVHQYSPDKDQFENCYEDLEVGQSYLLLSSEVDLAPDVIGGQEYKRWVWSGALKMSDAQLRKVYKQYKLYKNDIRRTVEYAENLLYPKLRIPAGVEF